MGLLISSREGGTRESPWNQCGPLTLCLGKGVRVEIDELRLPVPGWGPGGRDSHPRSPSQRPCRPHVAPGRLRRALGEVGAEMGGALRGAPWRMLGAWGALHRVGPGGMSEGKGGHQHWVLPAQSPDLSLCTKNSLKMPSCWRLLFLIAFFRGQGAS